MKPPTMNTWEARRQWFFVTTRGPLFFVVTIARAGRRHFVLLGLEAVRGASAEEALASHAHEHIGEASTLREAQALGERCARRWKRRRRPAPPCPCETIAP